MKKFYLALTTSVTVLFVISMVLMILPLQGVNQKIITNIAIPDSLYLVFINSCMPCHLDGGDSKALLKLNFSSWERYKPDKQEKKVELIYQMVTQGKMPPKSFKVDNPEFTPTPSQIKSMENWADVNRRMKDE